MNRRAGWAFAIFVFSSIAIISARAWAACINGCFEFNELCMSSDTKWSYDIYLADDGIWDPSAWTTRHPGGPLVQYSRTWNYDCPRCYQPQACWLLDKYPTRVDHEGSNPQTDPWCTVLDPETDRHWYENCIIPPA